MKYSLSKQYNAERLYLLGEKIVGYEEKKSGQSFQVTWLESRIAVVKEELKNYMHCVSSYTRADWCQSVNKRK